MSPHQLTSSVRTLAACARTMLWCGLPGDGPGTPQQRALEFLAEAMVAMLPGLDANDMDKSRAVLDLYFVVLHSVGGPLTVCERGHEHWSINTCCAGSGQPSGDPFAPIGAGGVDPIPARPGGGDV